MGKTAHEKVFKYVDLAKECNYVPPDISNIDKCTEDDIIFASINQFLYNEVSIMAQIIALKKYPILYPIFKTSMKQYIDKFKN